MSSLQKVALGTPPTAVDGDTSRGANTKMNANVDVLNTQATLTSTAALIISPQALTVAHVGTRVNINLAAAGTINLPAASTCANDQVILLRNLGATLVTLAITAGSGDTIGLTTLAAGESASLDTDGVHAWRALLRGRSVNANESVSGNFSITGTLTRAGNVVWDAANLSPVTTGTTQTIPSLKTFSGASGGTYTTSTINLLANAAGSNTGIGFNSGGIGGVFRLNQANAFDVLNFNATGYTNINCQTVTQASDQAIKENVEVLSDVMPRLRNKRGVKYDLKRDAAKVRQIGVIAQDWVTDFPELLSSGEDIDADGDFIAHQFDPDTGEEIFGPNGKPASRKLLAFKYTNAVAVLLQALIETDATVQSALGQIDSMQTRLSKLESK
jgi:hypothetical protein